MLEEDILKIINSKKGRFSPYDIAKDYVATYLKNSEGYEHSGSKFRAVYTRVLQITATLRVTKEIKLVDEQITDGGRKKKFFEVIEKEKKK